MLDTNPGNGSCDISSQGDGRFAFVAAGAAMSGQRSRSRTSSIRALEPETKRMDLDRSTPELSPKFCLKTFSSTRSYVDCG